jgi:hypothetical protein
LLADRVAAQRGPERQVSGRQFHPRPPWSADERNPMAKLSKVLWNEKPDDHDYPAAGSFLSLLLDEVAVARLVDALKRAPVTHYMAKDVLRSARLPILAASNPSVANDLKKIKKGRPLSPVLLVRGDLAADVAAQIADGYHRVCASYLVDEDAPVPCRIVPRALAAKASQRTARKATTKQ